MDPSIEELVRKIKNGDQMAATDLYNKTSNKAFYLAMELVKDEDMAQDILQDSYVKAFTNLNTLSDPAKFQSWFNSIVVNTSKNYLKKKSPILFSQMTTANDEGEEQDIDFEDESEEFSPEATVDYNETKRLVQEMIDNLPDAQRTAIVLHYMEDYSVKQIAEIMECTESTVKSRLNYGRKQLEKDVLDLEKKGTKLYCAPLIPFLIWMFHTTDAYAAFGTGAAAISEAVEAAASEAAASAVAATEASAASTSAAVTAKAAAGAAAKAGAGAVGKVTVAKIVAAIAAVCILGGGVAIGVTVTNRGAGRNTSEDSETSMAYEIDQEVPGEDTQNWQYAYDQAEDAVLEEDYSTAIEAYTKAISLNPNEAKTYLGRGNAYILSGETEDNLSQALSDYQEALELDDTLSDAILGIADVYIREGDYDTALEILKEESENDSVKEDLADKIAELESGTVTDLSGNIRRRVRRDDSGALLWSHEYTYGPDGRATSVTSYDADGNETGYVELLYRDDGQDLTEISYSSKTGAVDTVYLEYDDAGHAVTELYYDNDTVYLRYNNEYDEYGNKIKWEEYNEINELTQYAVMEYYENGSLKSDYRYNPDGTLYEYYLDERDSDGMLLNRRNYKADGSLRYMEVYYYDENGNLLGYERYDDGGNLSETFMYE